MSGLNVMRRTGLHVRLARLEGRRGNRPLALLILDTVYPEDATGDVIGAEAGDVHVERRAGEPLSDLLRRAYAETGAMHYAARYPENPADLAPPAPEPAPALPEGAQDDPWALAGIGRRATRSELERMGAAWLPPERLR